MCDMMIITTAWGTVGWGRGVQGSAHGVEGSMKGALHPMCATLNSPSQEQSGCTNLYKAVWA